MSKIIRNQKIKKAIVILLGIYVVIGMSLYFIQEKLMFHPIHMSKDLKYEFSQPFEELFLKSNDGAVINAIHFKTENPKGVILYFHGNASNLSLMGPTANYFMKHGYDIFFMDYRTYGKSLGKLSEQALYDDAQMCYDYLAKRYDESDITVYGRSLGTGIATYVASKNKPKRLILEAPYYSVLDIAQHRFPIYPVKYLLKYKIPTHEFVKNVTCPITIFHGTDDAIIPFESGEKLFEGLSKKQAQFIQIDGGSHNDLIHFETYRNGIDKLLK